MKPWKFLAKEKAGIGRNPDSQGPGENYWGHVIF